MSEELDMPNIRDRNRPKNHSSSMEPYMMNITNLLNPDHETKSYSCYSCSGTFRTRDLLRRHVLGVHVNTDRCDICKKALKFRGRSDNLRRHLYKCIGLQDILNLVDTEDKKTVVDMHVKKMMERVKISEINK